MNLFGIGPAEIILILFVLLLFFGKDRLPGLARSIGHSFKELKSALTNESADEDSRKNKKS